MPHPFPNNQSEPRPADLLTNQKEPSCSIQVVLTHTKTARYWLVLDKKIQ